jgi:AcrR family transcriptional regulator
VAGRAGKRRYEEVLRAAGEVFAEKGYDGCSTQDIADRLGILKGSLYYYTDSKESLLFELVEETMRQGLLVVEKIAEQKKPAVDRLRELVRAHIDYLTDNLVNIKLLLHERRSLAPAHRQVVRELEEAYQARMRTLVSEGQADGSIRKDLDPGIATLAILGALNWLYRWYQDGNGHLGPSAIADQFATILVEGTAEAY